MYNHYHSVAQKSAQLEQEWNRLFENYAKEYPKEAADLKRRLEGRLPDGWQNILPRYKPEDAAVASRKLSEAVLTTLVQVIPELIGGSADLTGSNNTRWKTAVDFQHVSLCSLSTITTKQ